MIVTRSVLQKQVALTSIDFWPGNRLKFALVHLLVELAASDSQHACHLGSRQAVLRSQKINRVEQGETDLTGIELEFLAQAYQIPLTHFFRRLAEYP